MLAHLAGPAAQADEAAVALPDYVVSVARMPQEISTLSIPVRVVTADELAAAPTLDTALRDDPAFSLFRRNTSFSANPTAQGVSLRGVGPSGASRTAVLLDDVPLNDPFGGWITWGQVPTLSLAGAEIAHGGGSSVWGSNALGGSVALATARLSDPVGAVALQAGSDAFWRAELTQTVRMAADSLRFDGRGESYGGFYALRAADRGDVDRPLDHRHWLGQLSWRHALSADADATMVVRGFDEHRGNGTELQQNSTRLGHAAIAIEGRDGARPLWKATAWFQRQEYTSFFTAVSDDRMSETPANDQYAVPATAAGLRAVRMFRDATSATVAGLDAGWVEGETRERYLFRDGAFAQRRDAGGRQRTIGIFAHHDRDLDERWHLSAALRADGWANTGGHTREASLSSGATTRDDRFPDRDGITLSPRVGVSVRLRPDTTVRAAVYRGFRVPTLNEYYRPFRVGSTSTLANPSLDPESLDGVDLGIEHRVRSLRFSAGLFWNQMHDAVGNVTLTTSPAGTTRQRQNIDRTRIVGAEFFGTWTIGPSLEVTGAALFVNAQVTRASAQPALDGRRLAQVPDYAVTGSLAWRASETTRLSAFVRATGRQFEDDENQLPLRATRVFGTRVDQRVSTGAACFLEITNVLDERTPTGRSTAGLITYDQPRAVRGGMTFKW